MKKIASGILAAALCCAAFIGITACGNSGDALTVYAPDGAPALALVNAISQNDERFEYRVVDSAVISAQVTGENPNADFCVLPINLASKLLGKGETYQMFGTVTNGNLYFLTTGENTAITRENLSTVLIGKTVGVVQLMNVPGLTFQAVLAEKEIPYEILESIQAEGAADKVNLVNMGTDATSVTPAYGCDYYLCSEPAATTKYKMTNGVLKPAGDLQELYGDGNGYPQAVLVAKTSVIAGNKAAVDSFISYMEGSAEYLKTVEPETVLSLLAGKRTEGLTPSFNANNLNTTVIANCSVRFTAAGQAKAEVNLFLDKLIAVKSSAASKVSDHFFYAG